MDTAGGPAALTSRAPRDVSSPSVLSSQMLLVKCEYYCADGLVICFTNSRSTCVSESIPKKIPASDPTDLNSGINGTL